MLAHYGVDTTAPGCSLRRVQVLVERLPPGTWPVEDEANSWTIEAHLLASVIDSVAALTFVTQSMWGAKPKQPKPFYRPGTSKSRRPVQPPAASQKEIKSNGWADFAKSLIGQPGVEVIRSG